MKIRITPGALLLLCVMAFTGSPLFWATLFAAAVHECGHLLAARLLRIRLRLLELDIPGARIVPAMALPSYRAEGLLAAAGPLVSLLLVPMLLPLPSQFASAACTATLSFALFNLLPITGFDGGRVLHACLAPLMGERRAELLLAASSYLSLLLLFALSGCFVLRYGQNLALAVLSASLFARLFLSQEMPRLACKQKRGF